MKRHLLVLTAILVPSALAGLLLYDSANLDMICTESGGTRVGDTCLVRKDSQGGKKLDLDWSDVTLMRPNTAERFYYPYPEKTENRDVFHLYWLVRLPERLGGGNDDVSSFRAYSAVSLTTDHCVIKYWSHEGRQRLEDPCWGSMYRAVDGLMTISPDHLTNTIPVALPYLDLSIDEGGALLVEPPVMTREGNGVVGIGRFISPQEIDRGSQVMVEDYERSHPHHPKVPVRFGGLYLTELHAGNDVEARYADLSSVGGLHISMRIDNVSASQQRHFLNLAQPDSEFWQLGDVVFKITGTRQNSDSPWPESFRQDKIEFILDGFYFEMTGQDIEFLKRTAIANYFPENTHDEMFLISSSAGR